MKTFTFIALAVALLASPRVYAAPNTGDGSSTYYSWMVALIGLGVAGTVAGLAASAASSDQATFSH